MLEVEERAFGFELYSLRDEVLRNLVLYAGDDRGCEQFEEYQTVSTESITK